MRRLATALVALTVLGAVLVGCGGEDEPEAQPSTSTSGPRPVTTDESNRLAITRFLNYQRRLVAFEIELAPTPEQTITLTGRADMVEHRAVASVVQSDPASYAVFAWNLGTFGSVTTQAPATDAELANAGEVPARSWDVRAFEAEQPLDQVLRVLLNLALENPDNAQLLRQNGAQWKASTTVDGVEVDVMTATPDGAGQTLTYYVAADGTLVRVDVEADLSRPATITFLPGDAASVGEVPVVEALGPEPTTEPSADPIG